MNATETTQTTTVDPKAVDATIAELSVKLAQVLARKVRAEKTIAESEKGKYVSRWSLQDAREQLPELAAERDRLRDELAPWEHIYAEHRWSRFFLVQNNGGHIHSSMSCSTCNKLGQLTDFGWLPELSGMTEADAVAAHGAILCTVCYPSAPVHFTNAHEEAAKARKEAQCPGSGKYVPSDGRRMRYVACPDCEYYGARTPSGLVRAHQPKA